MELKHDLVFQDTCLFKICNASVFIMLKNRGFKKSLDRVRQNTLREWLRRRTGVVVPFRDLSPTEIAKISGLTPRKARRIVEEPTGARKKIAPIASNETFKKAAGNLRESFVRAHARQGTRVAVPLEKVSIEELARITGLSKAIVARIIREEKPAQLKPPAKQRKTTAARPAQLEPPKRTRSTATFSSGKVLPKNFLQLDRKKQGQAISKMPGRLGPKEAERSYWLVKAAMMRYKKIIKKLEERVARETGKALPSLQDELKRAQNFLRMLRVLRADLRRERKQRQQAKAR